MNFLETYEICWESNSVLIVLTKRRKVSGWSNVVCGSGRPKTRRGWNSPPSIYGILHIFFTM